MSSVYTSALYQAFAAYQQTGTHFCTYCYSEDDIARLRATPLEALDRELSRTLLWESFDHWENADVYRHYLPRILEILGPPWNEPPLYPLHPSETLLRLGFRSWPSNERAVVIDYLASGLSSLVDTLDDEDRAEWSDGIAALGRESDMEVRDHDA
jgi:hypothetical protein